MAALVFRGFAGMIPAIEPINLALNQAVLAENCRLESGALRPWKGLGASVGTLTKAGAIRTLYRFGAVPGDDDSGFWFHWNERVHASRGPIIGDVQERTYFTGTDKPRYTYAGLATSGGGTDYPAFSRPLGVPIPGISPTATVAGDANEDADPLTDTLNYSYVVVYKTGNGEIGAPCLPSNSVDVVPGQYVELTGLPGAVAGEWDLTHKDIYRRESSAGGDEYYYVDTVPITQSSYTDDLTKIGSVLRSYQYYEPPEDMHGFGVLPAGFCYGFSKNQVCFSEVYLPHAWDPEIRLPAAHPIVGGGHFGDTVVAITTKNPWVATGQDPRSMGIDELQINQGCVSAASIVSTPYGVIYASPDGLFIVGPGGASNLLQGYMRPDQWQAFNPESIWGVFFEDRYFAFFDNGTEQGALLIKPADGAAGLVRLGIYATAAYADPLQDKLFLVQDHDVQPFDAGAPLPITWLSGEHYSPVRTSFSCLMVVAKAYQAVMVRYFVDGAVVATVPVTGPGVVRIPDVKGNRFQVEISAQSDIEFVTLAGQPSEVRAA